MLLLEELPEQLLIALLCDWIDPEQDLRAMAVVLGEAPFAGLVAQPGICIRATKILSKATVSWLAAHRVHVELLELCSCTQDAEVWFRNGQMGRTGDLPAITTKDGTRKWFLPGGGLHRDHDLPAVIDGDGTQCWYQNGQPHCDGDRPAIVFLNGEERWYRRGKLHRDGDLPASIWADGTKLWYRSGDLHRPYLPAVIHADGRVAHFWKGIRPNADTDFDNRFAKQSYYWDPSKKLLPSHTFMEW